MAPPSPFARALTAGADGQKPVEAEGLDHRTALWDELAQAAARGAPLPEAEAKELVQCVVATLKAYRERESVRAVDTCVRDTCVRDAGFAKVLAGAAVVTVEKGGAKLKAVERQVLLRWSLAAAQGIDNDAATKAMPRLAAAQAELLGATAHAGSGSPNPLLQEALRATPTLLPRYFEVLSGVPDAGFKRAALAAAMVHHCLAPGQPQLGESQRAALLEVYLSVVLSTKVIPPLYAAAGFAPLLATLSPEEFSAKVAPMVAKVLKRAPETVMEVLVQLFDSVTVDTSSCLEQLGGDILAQAHHKDEPRRTAAASLLQALAQGTSNVDALQYTYEMAKDILTATGSSAIKIAVQRAGVMNAIAALACARGKSKALVTLAEEVCAHFADSGYKAESQDDAKAAAIGVLGAWLPRAPAVPPDVVALWTAGLKESKDTVRRLHLRCLTAALQGAPERRTAAAALAESLCNLAKAGLAKAAQRAEGAIALVALAQICAVDKKAAETAEKGKIWEVAFADGSAMLSTAFLARMSAEDAAALACLPAVMLREMSSVVKGKTGRATLCKAALTLMLHPSPMVREIATSGVSHSLAEGPTWLPEVIVSCLSEFLTIHAGGVEGQQLPFPAEDDERVRRHLADAVAAVSAVANSASTLTPVTICLAHHPCTTADGDDPSILWSRVSSTVQALKTHEWLQQSVEIAALLLGDNGLRSTLPSERTAATRALFSLMRDAAHEVAPHLLRPLAGIILSEEHSALTDDDVIIWKAPEGEWALDPNRGAYKGEVVSSKNVKKTKQRGRNKKSFGETSSDESEDDIPTPAARPSQQTTSAPAKRGGSKMSPQDIAHQEVLRKESLVRARVQALHDRLTVALTALGSAAAGNPEYTAQHLASFATPILPLLASPLVSKSASDAVAVLVQYVQPQQMAEVVPELSRALKEVFMLKSADTVVLAESADIQAVVAALDDSCNEGPLPAPSFALVFPIIEALLFASKTTPLHGAVGDVLSMHCEPGPPYPRARIIALLRELMAKGTAPPRLRPANLIRRVSLGLDPEDLDELLEGLLYQQPEVRNACLVALANFPKLEEMEQDDEDTARLFTASHDPDETNAAMARECYERYGHKVEDDYMVNMLPLVQHTSADVRVAAGTAVAEAVSMFPGSLAGTLGRLVSSYTASARWEGRAGVLMTLRTLASHLTVTSLPLASSFLVKALGDAAEEVREAAVQAGQAVIEVQGGEHVGAMLPVFEGYLDRAATETGADDEQQDRVRSGVVIFMGALARHLDPSDPKIRQILLRMVDVLDTPSEVVQRGVSQCLPPLVPVLTQDERQELISALLAKLTQGKTYGERRGAAFGIAGAVKGLGISALKGLGVMEALKLAVEDKQSSEAREGSLMAFELLCQRMGRLFEPYVIHVLPMLLVCFGDSNAGVRAATEGAARSIMAQLSGQGVKLVLPALLKGLDDNQWRTKQGSVQLLGAMAFCAPKQLGSCLPTVVPKVTEALSDTHPKVQKSASTALKEVGSVIKNPEIQALVPSIIRAITKPTEKTDACLDALLETTFVNSVDAPSLALIIPVLLRGLRERKTELKKKSAKIAGNMCALVSDPADMEHYVPMLLPELKASLVDPNPEVRATSAHALASLLQGMGTDNFEDLLPWMLETLRHGTSSVERSGAAQGIAEALAVLGASHLETLMPEIVAGCRAGKPIAREGHLTLVYFLPGTLGDLFESHLEAVLPCILDGLADESEGVRDAAMTAGRTFVEAYADTSLPLLLPSVEEGLMSENWRIRQCSSELLGDLLFKVSGATGRIQTSTNADDDESVSTEQQGRNLLAALGLDRRNTVLAAVYMHRADVSLAVRNTALHVWKSVVMNTPRTLTEIMPDLMRRVISALASSSPDRQGTASACLGDLVRKLGERVLKDIMPILQDSLADGDYDTRQGVCNGLHEIMRSATRNLLEEYFEDIVPAIRTALCDEDSDVREAAGSAFGTLLKQAGPEAASHIVPALLASLGTDPHALEGLKEVLRAQPRILSTVLPRLVTPPIDVFRAQTIGSLAEVAGSAIPPHLSLLVPPLLAAAGELSEEGTAAAAAVQQVCGAVDEDGMELVVGELLRGLANKDANTRRAAADAVGSYAGSEVEGLEEHASVLIESLIGLFGDEEQIVQAAWSALGAVTSIIPKDSLPAYVQCVRMAVSTVREKERRKRRHEREILVPGFCLPKGLAPVVHVFLQGMLTASEAEAREAAADGLRELVEVTTPEAVKPHVIAITGPLIRIARDKFPWQVKASILGALGVMIRKGGMALKPFFPQLQTTFVKCLFDPAQQVRDVSAASLGSLMSLQPRVDAVATDLLNGHGTAEEPGVRAAMIKALKFLAKHAGHNLSEPVLERAVAELQGSLGNEEEDISMQAARGLGLLSVHLSPERLSDVIDEILCPAASQEERAGRAAALASTLCCSAGRVCEADAMLEAVARGVKLFLGDDRVPVRDAAARSAGWMLRHSLCTGLNLKAAKAASRLLALALTDTASEVKLRAVQVLRRALRDSPPGALVPHFEDVMPPLADCLAARQDSVKRAAERALRRGFNLPEGAEVASDFIKGNSRARKNVNDVTLKRLNSLPVESDVEDDDDPDAEDLH